MSIVNISGEVAEETKVESWKYDSLKLTVWKIIDLAAFMQSAFDGNLTVQLLRNEIIQSSCTILAPLAVANSDVDLFEPE